MIDINFLTKELSPTYETTLPFSKKLVTFSPFKVKDSKNISIILKEENKKLSLMAMVNVLKNNVSGVDIDDLCLADAEYLYLQMRGKSVGEELNLKVFNESIKLNISDIKTRNTIVSKNIKIKDGINAVVKTPKIKDLLNVDFNDETALIKKYLKAITIKNEIFDLDKFIPNELKTLIENLPYSFVKELEKISKEQPELYFTVKTDEGDKEVCGTLSFFTLLQTLSI